MTEFVPLVVSAIGIVGVIVGVLLNEYMRRGSRRELFAPSIFEKRLAAYEGLLEQIHEGSKVADEVIQSDEFTPEQRHNLIGVIIFSIIRFNEKNSLYIDEELGIQCMALFMGVEDIHDAPRDEKQELLRNYHEMLKNSRRMVVEDSGVAEVNRLFKAINKPKIDGPFIEYFRRAKVQSGQAK